MDQAEPENQILHRHQQECGDDANLDRDVRLFDSGVYQVPVKVDQKHATDSPAITHESF